MALPPLKTPIWLQNTYPNPHYKFSPYFQRMNKVKRAIFCGFSLLMAVLAMEQLPPGKKEQQKAIGFKPWREFIVDISERMKEVNEAFQTERSKDLGWSEVSTEIVSKYMTNDLDNHCVQETLKHIDNFLNNFDVLRYKYPFEFFEELNKQSGQIETRLANFPILRAGEIEHLQKLVDEKCPGGAAIEALLNYRLALTEYGEKVKKSLAKFMKYTKLSSLAQIEKQQKAIGFEPWKDFIVEISGQLLKVNQAMLTFQMERENALGWSEIPVDVVSKYMGNNVVGDFVEKEARLKEINNFLIDFNLPIEYPKDVFTRMGDISDHFNEQLDTFPTLNSDALKELENMLDNDEYCPGRAAIEALFKYRSTITEGVGNIKNSLAKFFEYTKLASLDQMLAGGSTDLEEEMNLLRTNSKEYLRPSGNLQKFMKIISEARANVEKALPTKFQSLGPQEMEKFRAELRGGGLLEAMLRFASADNRNAEKAKLAEMKELGKEIDKTSSPVSSSIGRKKLEIQLKVREKINGIVGKMRQKLGEQNGRSDEGIKGNMRNFGVQQLYKWLAKTAELLKEKLKEVVTNSVDFNNQQIKSDKAHQIRLLMETMTLHFRLADIVGKLDEQQNTIEKDRLANPMIGGKQTEKLMKADRVRKDLRTCADLLQEVFANLDRSFQLKSVYESLELDQRNRIRAEVYDQTGGPIVDVKLFQLPELAYLLFEDSNQIHRTFPKDGAGTSSGKVVH